MTGRQPDFLTVTFAPNSIWNWMTVTRVPSVVSLDDRSTFAAPDGVFTKVLYTAEGYDDQAQYDPGTSRFTAATAGDYEICASMCLVSSAVRFELDLYVNGVRENAFGGGDLGIGDGCRTVRLAPGDYVEVWLHQSSGDTVTFAPNSIWNWMTVNKLQ